MSNLDEKNVCFVLKIPPTLQQMHPLEGGTVTNI